MICAPHHVPVLRRLFWAIAFDEHADTLVLLAGPVLAPTPFDAAPSRPVIIARVDRTPLRNHHVAELLVRMRRRRAPDGTIKPRTFGMNAADAAEAAAPQASHSAWHKRHEHEEPRVDLVGGAIVFRGSSRALRQAALALRGLDEPLQDGKMGYQYVGESHDRPHAAGEVQVFGDYRSMLSDARHAREDVERRGADLSPRHLSDDVCAERAARSARRIERRRAQAARRGRTGTTPETMD